MWCPCLNISSPEKCVQLNITVPHNLHPLFVWCLLQQSEKLQDRPFSWFVIFFFSSLFHLQSLLPHLSLFSCVCVSSCCSYHPPTIKYKPSQKIGHHDCFYEWFYYNSVTSLLFFFFFFFSLECLLSFSVTRKTEYLLYSHTKISLTHWNIKAVSQEKLCATVIVIWFIESEHKVH